MGFLSRASVLFLFVTFVLAHPAHNQPQKRSVDLGAYRLSGGGSYISVPSTEKRSLKFKKRATNLETAVAFLGSTFPTTSFRLIEDHYMGDNGVEHFYFKQLANNLDIDNSNLNINVAKDGSILSYGHSLYSGAIPSARTLAKRDFVGPVMALKKVSKMLGLSITVDTATAKLAGTVVGLEDAPGGASSMEPSALQGSYIITGSQGAYQAPKARLVYLQTQGGKLSLVWRVETDILDTWLLSYVDAQSADTIMGVVEYVAHASYGVYPWGQIDPTNGPRVLETDPYDPIASPFTWQNTTVEEFGETVGNNAIAQANWNANNNITDDYRPRADGANFTYPLNLNSTDPMSYIDASVTQLFYTANMLHDLLYALGFTEAAGNFQEVNGNTNGVEGDPVILNSQDGSGLNNANFLTPPDGNSGRMRMYLWGTLNSTIPLRDSSFDSDIVIHEYTHGLSNRLTGGPANSACLNTLESNGMGEGWSDFIAIAVNMNGNETRATNRAVGAWAAGTRDGIREFLYSTDTRVNPLTYSRINNETITHNIGTVWNTMLYEILWNLIDKHGINTARKPAFKDGGVVPTDGRYLAMKLVIDAMALQPCNPSFVDARNAIVDADSVLTAGENACEIWRGFAKRGLGAGVVDGRIQRVNDFTVPAGIC